MEHLKFKLLTASLCFLAGPFLLRGVNLGYVYPAGARAGTTVRVIVGGQGLGSMRSLCVSGSGVQLLKIQAAPGVNYNQGCAEQLIWVKAFMREVWNGGKSRKIRDDRNFGAWRYNEFMEKLDQLDPLLLSLTCRSLFGPRTNALQASPAIAQRMVLTLRIAPDAEPGVREFRLRTPEKRGALQMTNPLRFYVGTVPEFQEQLYQLPPRTRQPVTFTFPAALNGQIEPGETDSFRFRLAGNEQVHFALKGRLLNPYIGDGVPGNFQPVLEVKDETGKSLAFADDNYFDPDPVLNFTAPRDGVYTLEIRDALYRGRADFVYRIDARRGPWRRPALVPPGCELPEYCEHAAAREVLTLPALISGTVEAPGTVRKFRFRAEKGQEIVGEVFARRQGSPLDSLLKILDPQGKQIACNDDCPRPNIGLTMQHVDSYLRFKAPEKGIYTAVLSDTAGAGGRDHGFFLRLDRPRPDFRVFAVPSAVSVSQDRGADPVKVVIERFDGFGGEISFELKNAENITLTGIRSVPAGALESVLSLSSTAVPAGENGPVFPELYAVSGRLRHRVRGADSAMQAFAYTHYVPAPRLILTRNWAHTLSGMFRLPSRFDHRIELKRGSSASVAVDFQPPGSHKSPEAAFSLPDAPRGVTLKTVRENKAFRLIFSAAKDAPPCAVNTAVRIRYDYKYRERNGTVRAARSSVFFLPVMRLTVR